MDKISLIDYFASQALIGLLASKEYTIDGAPAQAYYIAEIMMKEREGIIPEEQSNASVFYPEV